MRDGELSMEEVSGYGELHVANILHVVIPIHVPRKAVWLYPLVRDWRTALTAPRPTRSEEEVDDGR